MRIAITSLPRKAGWNTALPWLREVPLILATILVNVVCWTVTIRWAEHVNEVVFRTGSWPEAPPWWPVPEGVYSVLNLYLAGVCFLSGIGCFLAVRGRLIPTCIVGALSLCSGLLLALFSIIGTF